MEQYLPSPLACRRYL